MRPKPGHRLPKPATRLLGIAAAALLTATAGPATPGRAAENARTETASTHIRLAKQPRVTARKGGTPARTVHRDSPLGLIGLTWRGEAPDRIAVRHAESTGWSSWTVLETAGSRPAARGTEPVWLGRSKKVQVRAVRDGHDVTAELELITIDPADAPAPAVGQRRGTAGNRDAGKVRKSARPPVVTREQWGADEELMIWQPQYAPAVEAAVLHHTSETNDYTCDRSAAIVRAIYHYHAVELGWGDIGYHVLVDKCGTVFEGRSGGLARPVIGGHTGGFNRGTFGVAMMGNHSRAEPSAAALESVAAITAWKLERAGVDPHGRITLVSTGAGSSKYPEGAAVELPAIFGHRDVGDTVCPGDAAYRHLGRLRDRVADLVPGHGDAGSRKN